MKLKSNTLLLICALIVLSLQNQAQVCTPSCEEYVKNGSFESGAIPDCSSPDASLSINLTDCWFAFCGTPDRWDVQHPPSCISLSPVPSAHTGNCMAHIAFGGIPNNHTFREYMYTTTEPLVAGVQYRISFWARQQHDFPGQTPEGTTVGYALQSFSCGNPFPTPTSSAADYTQELISTNYELVTDIFTVTTGGVYSLYIGPFLPSGYVASPLNHLFVDDVSIQQVIPNPLTSNIVSHTDITCAGRTDGSATVSVSGGTTPYAYSWSPAGGTGSTASGLGSGLYTVTVTDAKGCTSTSSVTIGTDPFVVSASSTTSSVCSGNTTGLSATVLSNLHSPYQYYWMPASNVFNPTANPAATNPLINTSSTPATYNYSVTVTDATGCQQVVNVPPISVYRLPVISVSPNPSYYCDPGSSPVTVSSSGAITYSWSPTTNISCTTCSSVILSPSVSTTYIVTVTDNHSCSNTAPVEVKVYDCCSVPGVTLTFLDYTFTTDMIGQTFIINGTAEISGDVHFTGCRIYMGAGARINITSGVNHLYLENTNISSCNGTIMWEGIYLVGGKIDVISGSKITEAEAGIWASEGSQVKIHNSVFDRNHISVHLEHPTTSDNSEINDNNLFDCTSPLILPYAGQITQVHIQLKDMAHGLYPNAMNIGTDNTAPNIFKNAFYGIEALNSNVNIYNNNLTGPNNQQIFSAGIRLKNDGTYPHATTTYIANIGDVPVTGSILTPRNTFEHYDYGIYATDRHEVTIRGNIFQKGLAFQQLRTGVSVERCRRGVIDIRSNIMTQITDYGIQLQDNVWAQTDIVGNFINQGIPWSYSDITKKGIYVNNSFTSVDDINLFTPLLISTNRINNCVFGIQVMNQTGGDVGDNKIALGVDNTYLNPSSPDHWSGIVVQRCYNMEVKLNTIGRPLTTTPGYEIPDDLMREYLRGIVVDNSHGIDVFRNAMYNMAAATRIYDDCQGRTLLHCNDFSACNVGVHFDQALMDPQGDMSNPTNNRWFDFDTPIRNRLDGNVSGSPIDWYCNPLTPELDVIPYGPVIFRIPTAANTLEECTDINDPYPDPTERQAMLIRLIEDSLFATYGDDIIFRNHEEAYRVLKQNDTLLTYGDDSVLTKLQNFYSLTALSNIGILSDIRDYIINNDMANAILLNSELNTENLMEENSKFVNEIIIAANGGPITYDDNQHSQLLSIAYQMPSIGGEAVYRARAILKIDVDDTQFNYRLAGTSIRSEMATTAIYPNPNDGTFNLNYHVDTDHPAEILIRDVVGRTVHKQQLDNGNTHQIYLNMPSGIYFLILNSDNDNKIYKVVLE